MMYLLLFLSSAVAVFIAIVFFQLLGVDHGRHSLLSNVKWGVALAAATVVFLAALISVGFCLKTFTPRDWIQGAFAFVAAAIMFGGVSGFVLGDGLGADRLERLLEK